VGLAGAGAGAGAGASAGAGESLAGQDANAAARGEDTALPVTPLNARRTQLQPIDQRRLSVPMTESPAMGALTPLPQLGAAGGTAARNDKVSALVSAASEQVMSLDAEQEGGAAVVGKATPAPVVAGGDKARSDSVLIEHEMLLQQQRDIIEKQQRFIEQVTGLTPESSAGNVHEHPPAAAPQGAASEAASLPGSPVSAEGGDAAEAATATGAAQV